jgi:ribosomal protein L11 methyltransferase
MQVPKTLWRLTLRVPVEDDEAIIEQLFTLSGTYPSVRLRPRARTARIEAYFQSKPLLRYATKLFAHLHPRSGVLAAEDWAESWKRHFHVLRVGKHIIIKPTWRTHRARRDDIVIELDPGLSFGTGQHPTTRFCLKLLERLSTLHASHSQASRSLLDVGTGTGILAIAATRLGYAPILAVDNDPQAVRAAKQNARINRVRFPVRVIPLGKLTAAKKFDVVTANLLADLIRDHRRKLAALVAPGGYLVLAGILAMEAPAVRRAFRELRLKPFACETRGNWTGFVFYKQKRGRP